MKKDWGKEPYTKAVFLLKFLETFSKEQGFGTKFIKFYSTWVLQLALLQQASKIKFTIVLPIL